MKMLLRVEHPNTEGGEPATDVEVTVTPAQTVGELSSALASYCELPNAAGRPMVHRSTGRILPGGTTVGESGIVSGDTVAIGIDESQWTGDDHGEPDGLHLVVTSGLDAGRALALTPGRHTIGRASSATLALTDPQVSRTDIEIQVTSDLVSTTPIRDIPAPNGSRLVSPLAPPIPGEPWVEITVDPGRDRTNELRLNGKTITARTALRVGDSLRTGTTTLQVRAPLVARPNRPGSSGAVAFERTPQFHQPIEIRQIDALGRIPVKPQPRRFQMLAVFAPLLMGFAMAFIFDSPRYLLFAVMSPVIGVGNYIDGRRSGGKDYKRNVADLRRRLVARQTELAEALVAERRLRHRNSPDPVELVQRAIGHSKMLWNRARLAENFLLLQVGLGTIEPSVVVKAETQGDDDLRREVEKAMVGFDRLVDVPVTVELASAGVVAFVGDPAETTSLAGGLALQAGCLHSPEDLVIASAISQRHGINEWLKWLPHVRSKNSPIGEPHLAGTRVDADRLIRAVGRIAETRAETSDQRLDLRWPWILLFVDRALEPEPATMARLLDLGAEVGVSVVWLTGNDRYVPRQAEIVARLNAPERGVDSRISYVDPELADQYFEPVRIGGDLAERAARSLAPLVDASATNAAAAVPGMVTLFEALGVDRIEPEWIAEQWLTNRGYSLPTPVGLTDTGPLTLDLVRHGPHGLIGGTSGAGKSELVQSLVANLIALNSPERVNLLFIDYKGGALSGLFADVPHSVGAVTNLDALLSLRALTSLKAELDHRMTLFEQHNAKDIKEMIERHPEHAPASLVIVVDEFASLVRELPEFVDGIVSIAERGRSLGIHLLLSTQRPSGSINENIQQNTNLRMSLRMLDSGESNNVIGTPAAATIPGHLKGRGFARLGPGELIAFQSAWSGAPLGGGEGPRPIRVTPFTAVEDRRRPDRIPPGPVETGTSAATELDAVLAAVARAAEQLSMSRGRAPWMETLPDLIPLAEVLDDPRADRSSGARVSIGMIDNPEAQDQYPATIDLADGGGLAVYGSGGSGKTTTLLTAVCSAAIRDSQLGGGRLTVFGIDFGSRQLGVLTRLPQCETVAAGDDLEAVTRVVAALTQLFVERRNASALATNDGTPAPDEPPVLLVIDGYDALAEAFQSAGNITVMQPWYDRIVNLVTQGRQVGIFTILATGTMSGASGRLMNSISNRITLRQTDDNTYRSFGIPSAIATGLNLAPGQALTRSAESLQIAVVGHRPGPDGEREVDPNAVGVLADGLVGSVNPACRTNPLPETVQIAAGERGDPSAVRIGVADLSQEPVAIDVGVNGLCVLGPPRSGRSNALVIVAEQLLATGAEVWAFGSAASPLRHREGWAGSAFGRTADIAPVLQELVSTAEQFTGVARFMLFDDVDRFDDMSLNAPLKAILESGVQCCGSATSSRSLVGSNPLHRELKSARNLLALKAEDDGAIHAAVGARYLLRPGLAMTTGRGVLVADGMPTVIQTFADPSLDADGSGETDREVPNNNHMTRSQVT